MFSHMEKSKRENKIKFCFQGTRNCDPFLEAVLKFCKYFKNSWRWHIFFISKLKFFFYSIFPESYLTFNSSRPGSINTFDSDPTLKYFLYFIVNRLVVKTYIKICPRSKNNKIHFPRLLKVLNFERNFEIFWSIFIQRLLNICVTFKVKRKSDMK